MKRLSARCVFLLLLVAGCGCGNDAGDRLYKQQIALLEEQAEAIEADSPEPTQASIKSRQAELQKELNSLRLSDRQIAKLHEDNKEAFQKARTRLLTATKKHLDKTLERSKGVFDKMKGE